MSPNYMEDHHGEQVTLHNLCYLIYQGFGQHAVHNFVEHNLPEVVWSFCEGCDIFSPIHEDACLVCGTSVTINHIEPLE